MARMTPAPAADPDHACDHSLPPSPPVSDSGSLTTVFPTSAGLTPNSDSVRNGSLSARLFPRRQRFILALARAYRKSTDAPALQPETSPAPSSAVRLNAAPVLTLAVTHVELVRLLLRRRLRWFALQSGQLAGEQVDLPPATVPRICALSSGSSWLHVWRNRRHQPGDHESPRVTTPSRSLLETGRQTAQRRWELIDPWGTPTSTSFRPRGVRPPARTKSCGLQMTSGSNRV
jgi:hypothetical protein